MFFTWPSLTRATLVSVILLLRLNDKPTVVQRAGVLNITNHNLAQKYIHENVEKI